MENNGLVVKAGCGQNLYRAKILLTEKGEEAVKNISMTACLAVESAGKGVSDLDREIFYNTLDGIAENLEEICNKGLN